MAMAAEPGDKEGSNGAGGQPSNAGYDAEKTAPGGGGGDQPHRDRRTSQRVAVSMWVEEVTAESQVFRRAENLSSGGLYLDKTIPIPIGTVVELRFTLPGASDPLSLKAEIVSIEPEKELGMGVKFVSVDAATQAQIDEYLKKS